MGYRIRGNTIHVFGTVDGKYYRLSTGKEATQLNLKWIAKNHEKVLLQLVEKLKQPKPIDLVEYGRSSLEANAYARKENTTKGYFSLFNKHIVPYFKHYRLSDIKPGDIKRFQTILKKQGLSTQSIRNIRKVLSNILNDAFMDGLISVNPIKRVKAPRKELDEVENDISPFTLEEVEIILNNSNDWLRQYLTVAFFTGMRTGELLALKWEDIDFVSKKIHVRRSMTKGIVGLTKTGRSRIIDMLPIVEKILKELFAKNGLAYEWIFTHKFKEPYKEPGFISRSMWRPTIKKCGVAYRKLYNTRHTFATMMLLGGEDILWVSQMLGHSDISTTMKYYVKYVQQKSQKRATFLDDFDTKLTHQKNGEATKPQRKAF